MGGGGGAEGKKNHGNQKNQVISGNREHRDDFKVICCSYFLINSFLPFTFEQQNKITQKVCFRRSLIEHK